MLRVATVCSGIGAPEKALTNLDIPYELVCFSEIDEAAIKSYCAIHDINCSKNFGNLMDVNVKPVPLDIDLLIGGTPCQSFSTAGKGEGGDEGSGTKSSLMWSYLQFIALSRPKVVVWENVPGVLSQKHLHNFRKFYFALMAYGYHVYSDVLNAKYFNIPQNRERLFLIAIQKGVDEGFDFPRGYDSGVRIKHLIDKNIPSQLSEAILKNAVIKNPNFYGNTHCIIRCGDLNLTNYKQDNMIISVEGISTCLLSSNNALYGVKIYDDTDNYRPVIRRFTASESFRFMGFDEKDYNKCHYIFEKGKQKEYISEADLYVQAGNSIVVTVLMAVFGALYDVEDWEDRFYKERKKTPEQLIYELPLFEFLTEQSE